jgi:hypothetical protein
MPTCMTALGGGGELVNLDQGAPIPASFVLQLADELTPPNVADGTGSAVVLHHLLDLQAFGAYDLVLAHEGARELVLLVPTSISYASVDCGHPVPCFGTVLGASSRIFGDGDTRELCTIRQGTRPHHGQGLVHPGQGKRLAIPGERSIR